MGDLTRGMKPDKKKASGLELLRDLRSIPCSRGILGFAEYVTHFAGAINTIRETEVSALPPHKMLISTLMSNAKDEPLKSRLEAYVGEHTDEDKNVDLTVDMLLEESIAVINFILYQKGNDIELQRFSN
jgi:hypothetical protein